MLQTKYGIFDGNSWEELCQLIFKFKYSEENYVEIPASPGDFGIEGFVKNKGIAFQCYCPNKHYTQSELYTKQRDKITEDLGKLEKYQNAIKERIGDKRIKEWVFVTPVINDNKLSKHAQTKEIEVRKWNLGILADDFTVSLKDADHFFVEIHTVSMSQGKKSNSSQKWMTPQFILKMIWVRLFSCKSKRRLYHRQNSITVRHPAIVSTPFFPKMKTQVIF